MRRFGFGFVVGTVLVFIGAALVFDLVFSVHLPIVRAAIAILFVALGVRILTYGARTDRRAPISGDAWMADRRFAPEGPLTRDARYDVVFGRGVVDLTHLEPPSEDVTVTVEAVFGTAVVKVDPTVAYDVAGSAAFGEVRMPDRSTAALGSVDYHRGDAPHLHVRVNAVFGACQVVEAARPSQGAVS